MLVVLVIWQLVGLIWLLFGTPSGCFSLLEKSPKAGLFVAL